MFIQRALYLFGNDFDCLGIEINPTIPATTLREFPSVTPQSSQDLKAFLCHMQEDLNRKMATCGLKQEAFLLIIMWRKELNSLLSMLASRDFAISGKFSPLPAK